MFQRLLSFFFSVPEEEKEIFDLLADLEPAVFAGIYSSDISALRVNGSCNTIVDWVQALNHFKRLIDHKVVIPPLLLRPFEEIKPRKFVIEIFSEKGMELEPVENISSFASSAMEFYHAAKTIDITRSDADYKNSQSVNVIILQLDSFIQDLIDVQEEIRGYHTPQRRDTRKRRQKYLS